MNQLGIVARIALIVTGALFLGQIAFVASYMWQSERSPLPPYAIANRISAVVRLLDDAPQGLRAQALAVADVSGFSVEIMPRVPETFVDDFSFARMRVLAQSMLDDYAPGRTVRAGTLKNQQRDAFTITFITQLKTREFAVFTVSDKTTLRVWNMPIGFIAGFFGIAIALLAIFAVARETRPLSQLAHSVDELGSRVEPIEVRERGARELRTLIRAINKMQDRILGLLNNRTLFLGAISHDLKTYLTRFRLRLEMMPAGTHRDKAIRDVEAMEQLLGDALLFASESAAKSETEIVDLSETLRRCASEMDPQGSRIELAPAAGAVPVKIPATALQRVIDNLLSNALRYGHHAYVGTQVRDGRAILIVEDDGPGIPPGDLELVFEPFFRGEPSRNRDHGGTGLGLAIVRQILDAQGGTIQLSSREARSGLKATVSLPLVRSDALSDQAVQVET
jgi:signal transduction histidine kinase